MSESEKQTVQAGFLTVISVNWAILTVSRKIATVVPTILAILTVLKQD